MEAELKGYGAQGLELLNGEGIERVLPLDGAADGDASPPLLLLTDKRVIYLSGQGKRRRAMYASVGDVQAVEIGYHARGNGAYVWAGLAMLAAFFLFFVIENTLGRIAGPVVVAGLGVYLVVDNLLTSQQTVRGVPGGRLPAIGGPGRRRGGGRRGRVHRQAVPVEGGAAPKSGVRLGRPLRAAVGGADCSGC